MALFGTVLTYYSAHQVLGGESMSGLNWSVLVLHASQFDKTVMRLAFIFILLGFGTKAGLAPMHTWKPDAYSEAPIPIAALMATAVLNCAVYALARFHVLTVLCLGPAFSSHLLILFGLLSVGVAVPFILVQRSSRRLLAYSSIDNGGIMVLGLGFGGAFGALAMLLHMTFHTVTKPLLFFCVGNAQQHTKTDSLRAAAGGLIHVLPITAPMLMLGALAVTGTPPFGLFQSEFMVLRAGFAGPYMGVADPACRLSGGHLLRLLLSHFADCSRPAQRRAARNDLPLEDGSRDRAFPDGDSDGILAARSALSTGGRRGAHTGGASMTQPIARTETRIRPRASIDPHALRHRL